MDWFELVQHRLEFEVQQAGVMNFLEIVFVTKNPQQRLVVQTQDQVGEAKNEEPTFVKAIHCSQSLPFYRVIS